MVAGTLNDNLVFTDVEDTEIFFDTNNPSSWDLCQATIQQSHCLLSCGMSPHRFRIVTSHEDALHIPDIGKVEYCHFYSRISVEASLTNHDGIRSVQRLTITTTRAAVIS